MTRGRFTWLGVDVVVARRASEGEAVFLEDLDESLAGNGDDPRH
jgi:hypothetical protein